jgi:hypothetical protein
MTKQEEFIVAIINNNIDKIKILLKNIKVNPSEENNKIIKYSYKNKNINIVDLLWNEKRVKNTLKNDDLILYNELMKKDIADKIGNF